MGMGGGHGGMMNMGMGGMGVGEMTGMGNMGIGILGTDGPMRIAKYVTSHSMLSSY